MTGRDGLWFVAGLLSAGAVLIMLFPWVRRESTSATTPQSLPRWLWLGAPVLIIVAAGLYAWLGSPGDAVNRKPATGTSSVGAAGAAKPTAAGSMTQVVAGLEARLIKNGGSDADWNLLAQSYDFLGRPAEANLARQHQLPPAGTNPAATAPPVTPAAATPLVLSAAAQKLVAEAEQARRKRDFRAATKAYAELAQMQQMNADTWADYADVQASADGKLATPQTAGYIERALQLDPSHTKALWLKASLQEENSQFAAAAQTFQTLVARLPPESSDAKLIRAKIAEDQKLVPTGAGTAVAAGGTGPRLRGEIVLDPTLQGRVRPGMTLFVLATAVGEAGPPVAVYRTTTASWPLKFELTNANAMLPGHDLSSAREVLIEARISRSGQALAQPGDLQGSSAPLVPAGSKPLRIVINKVIG